MFTLLNELHFWTYKSEIAIRDTDFGAFCYYEKRSLSEDEWLAGKKSYSQQRGIVWSPSNKRPAKLRHSIQELEEYLETSSVVYSQWKEPDSLLVILNSGLLVSLKINILTGDLEHVYFDKHLVGKLASEHVSDVAVGGSEAVFAIRGGKVLAVHYAKSALKSSSKHWVTVDTRSSDLIATSSHQSPSLNLRITSNSISDKLAFWWESEEDPWQQMSSSNFPPIHIYHFTSLRVEPACCLRTEAQPVLIMFSHFRPSILHIVVQIISSRGDVWVGWCQMDIACLRGDRGTAVQPHRTIPVQGRVTTVALSPIEDKLLIASVDSTLVVADYAYDCVVTNRTTFERSVKLVAWHPDSCLLVAGDEIGNIQFFDSSLSPIRAQFSTDQHSPQLHLDIGAYFKHQPTLMNLSWNKKPTVSNSTLQIDAFLFLHFRRGPLGILKLLGGSKPGFPVDSVVCHYLSGGSVDRAISLLSTLAWDTAGSSALASMQSIVNYLLTKPLTPHSHALLDKAVGCYFDCKRSISRITCVEFNDSITDIRRKIFHQLLRYQVYESALKLAIDLGHYDLLMDLHNQAKASGLNQLASTALEKAEQISEYSTSHSRSSVSSHSSYESSCSWCSRSSCSDCKEEKSHGKRSKLTNKRQKSSSEANRSKSNTVTSKGGEDKSSNSSRLLPDLGIENETERKNGIQDLNIEIIKKKPLVEPNNSIHPHSSNIELAIPFNDVKSKTGEEEVKQHIEKIRREFDHCIRTEDKQEPSSKYETNKLKSSRSMDSISQVHAISLIEKRYDCLEATGAKSVKEKIKTINQCSSNEAIKTIDNQFKINGLNENDNCKINKNDNKFRFNSDNIDCDQYNIINDKFVFSENGNYTYDVNKHLEEINKADLISNQSSNHISNVKEVNPFLENSQDEDKVLQGSVHVENHSNVREEFNVLNCDVSDLNKKGQVRFEMNPTQKEICYGNSTNNTIVEDVNCNKWNKTGENSINDNCHEEDKNTEIVGNEKGYDINQTKSLDIYYNRSRDSQGRISAEFDRDCLADAENGVGMQSFEKSHVNNLENRQESIYMDKSVNDSKQGENSHNDQISDASFNFLTEMNGEKVYQEPPQLLGRGERHQSSLWGKDRIHVQNVVGDQWFGSLVRVSKNLRFPMSTSQNINPEGRGIVQSLRDCEWSDYQGYIKPRENQNNRHSNFPMFNMYRNNQGLESATGSQKRPPYQNLPNQWYPDQQTNQNMCDLQKVSFLNEDSRLRRKQDQVPNLVHHNWMEPNSVREHSVRSWRPNPPLPLKQPLSYQPSQDINQRNVGLLDNDNLYERLNPNVTRWDISTNKHPNLERSGDWPDSRFNQRPRELSPSRHEMSLARVGPNLWIGPPGAVNHGGGIFWPKPYLGPRERPPPPPPPPPPRPKVQFSDSVTHIPNMEERIQEPVVEGNINIVGLPDASFITASRKQVPSNQSSQEPPPIPPLPLQSDTFQESTNDGEDSSKVKVVHFGLV